MSSNQKNNLKHLNTKNTTIIECYTPAGTKGPTGTTGPNGENAYEVAVRNGFIGTVQEWLNSLVGPTGENKITKTIIPYYMSEFTGGTRPVNGEMEYTLTTVGFGINNYPLTPDNLGPPQSFTINEPNDTECIAFSSAYDFSIKSIAFSSIGGGELPSQPINIKIAVFLSEQGSNVFTIEPTSILTLLPDINSYLTILFNVNGAKNTDIFVPANTKVAVVAYLESVDDQHFFMDVAAFLSGSITIESN